jgi:hypothetical protein
VLLHVFRKKKNPSELNPATETAMQSTLHVQSTFPMSRSPTAEHIPYSVLELVVLKPQLLPHSLWHIFKRPR